MGNLFNRKIWIFALALMLVGVVAVGCGGEGDGNGDLPENQENGNKQNGDEQPGSAGETLDDVVEHFRGQGLAIGEKIFKVYDMIGAIDGFGIEVEGEEIELYMFDPAAADSETLEQLESAKTKGQMSMSGFVFPVTMNGNIMLTRYDEHSEKERIIEAFKKF